MIDVRRYDDDKYDIHNVPESMMMQIVIGLKKVQDDYKRDLKKYEFRGKEDQAFLQGEVDAINRFIASTQRYFTVTETGWILYKE